MSISYAVVYAFIIGGVLMAFLFTANIAYKPNTYIQDIEDFISLVCFASENPGFEFKGYIRIEGNLVVRNGSIVLDEDFWVLPACGSQEGRVVYLPLLNDEEFNIGGYQFCVVRGVEDGFVEVRCGG